MDCRVHHGIDGKSTFPDDAKAEFDGPLLFGVINPTAIRLISSFPLQILA